MSLAAPAIAAPRAGHAGRRLGLCAAGMATLAAMALAATVASDHGTLVAAGRALIVGIPVGAGISARYRGAHERFGGLLIAVGAASLLTSFAESSDPGLYTAGRAAGWLFEVLLVYVILAFPTGRLGDRGDRALVGAAGLAVLLLYLPRLLVDPRFDVPSPFTSCTAGCPANPLFALGHEPAAVDALLRPAGAAIVLGIALGVSIRTLDRLRTAPSLTRRADAPVFAIAAAQAALLGVGIAARQLQPAGPGVQAVSWLLACAGPALAVAFLVALVRRRLLAGRALERLAIRLRTTADARILRRALAEAFGDPDVQILFPAPGGGGWVDGAGEPAPVAADTGRRSVTEVRHDGRVIAALLHDPGLREHPELLDAGGAIAGFALETSRLAARAESATREVAQSRARIAAGAERERRRIERDLHDGAQQRLVALRIELGLAEGLVVRDPEKGAARLRDLETEVDTALEEIRSLAHGMYPPLLADRGIPEAVRAAASGFALPVDVEAHDVGRYPAEVESAVYFSIREALQNVLKHATGAGRVRITLDGRRAGALRFLVEDDGAGAPDGVVRPGAGITNMRDRVAAVGGELEVSSTPGAGTVVRGNVDAAPGSGAPTAAPDASRSVALTC